MAVAPIISATTPPRIQIRIFDFLPGGSGGWLEANGSGGGGLEGGNGGGTLLDMDAYPFVGESYNNGRVAHQAAALVKHVTQPPAAPASAHPAARAEKRPAVAGRAASVPQGPRELPAQDRTRVRRLGLYASGAAARFRG